MITTPRHRAGPTLSRYLPRTIESELRTQVLDAVDDYRTSREKNSPQLILMNTESGCHGTYSHRHDGVVFVFHHCKTAYATTQCQCLVRSSAGEPTYQIPQDLDDHRMNLIFGRYSHVPWRLESKLAAMVTMKLFLGMEVPAPLGMEIPAGTAQPESEEVGERKGEEDVDVAS
ncbi:hypothetical protein CIB48_g123 [Xylaria polymorpha]|nr:hypothetical protein CIB48_g123 [Xylaria polymorpha]